VVGVRIVSTLFAFEKQTQRDAKVDGQWINAQHLFLHAVHWILVEIVSLIHSVFGVVIEISAD